MRYGWNQLSISVRQPHLNHSFDGLLPEYITSPDLADPLAICYTLTLSSKHLFH